MSSFWNWEHVVAAFSILCHAVLLWHLNREGLTRYRALTGLLAVELIQSVVLFPLDYRTAIYAWFYFVTSPLVWLFFYLVIFELVNLILVDFPGVASAVRRLYSLALAAAVLVSAAVTLSGAKGPPEQQFLVTFLAVERFVILALLVFLVFTLGILFYFRVPLSPNRKRYAIGYALYFGLGVGILKVLSDLGPKFTAQLGNWLVASSCAVLLAGVVALHRRGEVTPKLQVVDERERAQRELLNQQLTELNRVLSRAARSGR